MADFVLAVFPGGNNLEGSAGADGQFSYAIGCSGAFDFDFGEDEVAWFVLLEVTRGVDSMGGEEASVFREVSENFCCKTGLCVAETEEFVEVVDSGVVVKKWGNDC